MDTYSIDRNLAAMSSGTAYAPTHIDSWCSGADWARYRFEKIVADLQKEIEELKSELHRAQEMRRIGENEMSAFGCCGEYNEHSPKCVTVKYQKALEMIEQKSNAEHVYQQALWYAAAGGEGYILVDTDYVSFDSDEQEYKIVLIDNPEKAQYRVLM